MDVHNREGTTRTHMRLTDSPERACELVQDWIDHKFQEDRNTKDILENMTEEAASDFNTGPWAKLTKRIPYIQSFASDERFIELGESGVTIAQQAGFYVQMHEHIFDLCRLFLRKYLAFYEKDVYHDDIVTDSQMIPARNRIRQYFSWGRSSLCSAVDYTVDHSGWDKRYNWEGDEDTTQELIRKLLELDDDSPDAVTSLDNFIKSHLPQTSISRSSQSPITSLRHSTATFKANWKELNTMEDSFNKTKLFGSVSVAKEDKRKSRKVKSGPVDDSGVPDEEVRPWPGSNPGSTSSKKGSRRKRKAAEMQAANEPPQDGQ